MKRTPLKRTALKVKPATSYMCKNRCGVKAIRYAGTTPVCGMNCAFEFTVKEAAKKKKPAAKKKKAPAKKQNYLGLSHHYFSHLTFYVVQLTSLRQ